MANRGSVIKLRFAESYYSLYTNDFEMLSKTSDLPFKSFTNLVFVLVPKLAADNTLPIMVAQLARSAPLCSVLKKAIPKTCARRLEYRSCS